MNEQPNHGKRAGKLPPASRVAGRMQIGDSVGMTEMLDTRSPKITGIQHDEHGHVTYTLDSGEQYTFKILEELAFPRRSDGQTTDWVRPWAFGAPSPSWGELRSGDRIPNPFDHLTYKGRPWTDPDSGYGEADQDERLEMCGDFEEELAERAWFFVRMNKPNGKEGSWAASFIDQGKGERVRVLSLATPVLVEDLSPQLREWKRPTTTDKALAVQAQFEWAGPYRSIQDDGNPGERIALFAIKDGPGRWPKEIKEFDPAGEGRMRPPTSKVRETSDPTAWSRWRVTEDGVKHPHDTDLIEKWDVTQAKLRAARETPVVADQDESHD